MEAKTAQKKKASPIQRDGFKIKQNNKESLTQVYETLNNKDRKSVV